MSMTSSYVRFPLTVLVLLAHFNFAGRGFAIHGEWYGVDMPLWSQWIIDFFGHSIRGIVVQIFMLLSGYFFFYRKTFTTEVYKKNIKKRFRTLVVPYLLWNTLAILCIAVRFLPIFSKILPGMDKVEVNLTPLAFLYTYFDFFHEDALFVYPDTPIRDSAMPIDAPLWYLRELMVLCLISPLFYWLIKKLKAWSLLIWATVSFVITPCFFTGWLYMQFVLSFYFALGAYYSLNGKNFVTELRKYPWAIWVWIAIVIADNFSIDMPWRDFLYYAGGPFGCVAGIIITAWLIEKKGFRLPEIILASSFFVYALHMLFMWDLCKALFVLLHLNDNTWVLVAFYFLGVVLTYAICVGIYSLMGKVCPGFRRLLTGGR